jgi:citrate lyase subunit beta/citryl-CoA lyase
VAKPYGGAWVLRSMLFVPSHIEKMVRKGAESEADCVVLDLEDAVPDDKKEEARTAIRESLASGLYARKTAFVRINPLETGLTLRDLDGVACRELHGFVYPMAYTPDDIKNFDAQLRLKEISIGLPVGHFSLIVLIETALGVLNAYPIAKASSRVVGLLFGCEDYFADTEARHSEGDTSLHTPRALTAIAARAAGVEPVDTPYVRVHDLDGLVPFSQRGRDLGMAGMLVMTPKQIPTAHATYPPSAAEVTYAKEVVAAAEAARREGRGIVVVDGKFISPPTLKAARKVLARAEAIENLTRFHSGR